MRWSLKQTALKISIAHTLFFDFRHMSLSRIDESLLLAAFFRGMLSSDFGWVSSSDQIITLSLFYTGDITFEDCVERFAVRAHLSKLYNEDGELTDEIHSRYRSLRRLLQASPELIKGGGNWTTPADPTYTSCRLTEEGRTLAASLIPSFPRKPDFPHWPDRGKEPAQI